MVLEKHGTCKSCGYENKHCICNQENQHGTIYPRNTSGNKRMYQNYTNYGAKEYDDYSRTSRIHKQNPQERKIMEELHPIDGELLITFLQRSEIAEQKLTEYSYNQHIYNTSKTWSCHTTSRYCFICVMLQYVNVNRALFENLQEITDISDIHIKLTIIPNGIPEISLFRAQPSNSSQV